MAITLSSPSSTRFIRADLSFEIDGEKVELKGRPVSAYGATALPWGKLNPQDHFGMPLLCNVKVLAKKPFKFQTRAHLIREVTPSQKLMGVRFHLAPHQRAALDKCLSNEGSVSSEFNRKFPRIPASADLETFPLRAMLLKPIPLILDVLDLSPNGIMVSTENMISRKLEPRSKVILSMEPRGWFPSPVRVEGQVMRITDDLYPGIGNLIRFVGIRFTRFDTANHQAFIDLMKTIVIRLQKNETSST